MKTDNELYDAPLSSGWGENSDIANVTQTRPQSWFWSSSWQAMEREAETDLTGGHYEIFETDEAFLASLQPTRRHVQPLLAAWPLALGRWIVKRLRRK